MSFWRDVNAPDTAWRPGSEDPIPVLFGRRPVIAFFYRYFTCRPLDGHARTDATFWSAGGKALTVSGRVMPYQFWAGWKRGVLLTRIPPLLMLWLFLAARVDGPSLWLNAALPSALLSVLLAYFGVQGVDWVRTRKHAKEYLNPIRDAVIRTLRTRDGVYVRVPRGMVRAADKSATGVIGLPPGHPIPEGDRDNLLMVVRERLAAPEIDARFNMEGSAPVMEIFIPPQPPPLVSWETMVEKWDAEDPYCGESAHGAVHWKRGLDSPHIAIIGGSGSGKSELVGWLFAQLLRGGAGGIVLDPKYSSHKWIMGAEGVLYCTEAAMLHDTILWLDGELRRRGRISQTSDEPFDQIAVILEERNSLQSLLQEYWATIRPTGFPMMSPAKQALDRLASMGRTLGVTVLLAGQYAAERYVGKRSNYGVAALAGRLPVNEWRNFTGASFRKPGMSERPGSFGYFSAGSATVFQAAFPDIADPANRQRLVDFAFGGDAPLNIQLMMQQPATHTFPGPSPVTSQDQTDPNAPNAVTLRTFADEVEKDITFLRNARDRDASFPDPLDLERGPGNARLYHLEALREWYGGGSDGEGVDVRDDA